MERASLPLFAFNVGAVQFWRSAARPYGARSWRGAMERFALQHGRAIAHLADDSALVVERLPGGRLQRSTIAADSVCWTR